jgi:hypothetical protein
MSVSGIEMVLWQPGRGYKVPSDLSVPPSSSTSLPVFLQNAVIGRICPALFPKHTTHQRMVELSCPTLPEARIKKKHKRKLNVWLESSK